MNIILLEDSRAPFFSTDIKSKFPRSCTVVVNKRVTKDYLKIIETPPTLKNRWLVIVEGDCSDTIINYVSKFQNNIVLIMADNLNYTRLFALVKNNGDSKILNVINVDEETGTKYICSRLDVTEQVAKYLVKLCNGFMPHIEESIIVLENVEGIITKSVVDRYIQKRDNLTIHSLFYHLIGNKILAEKQLVMFLYKYKYAISYVKKRLIELFDSCISLYSDIEDGSLGSDNVDVYCSTKKLKVSKYFVNKVVNEIHSTLDYSTLLVLRYRVMKMENMITLLDFI